MLALDRRHLVFGLIVTWLVGIGRYWDDPGAKLLQHLGLGSVIYVFALSALLWLVFKPVGANDWTYARVLTLVTLTAPPALLYAIPVERFMNLADARTVNVWFLGVVAIWRVALFVFFARRLGQLSWLVVVVGTLLPLTLIITALVILNLERAVFAIMGGLRDERTANDGAYALLSALGMLSMGIFPLVLLAWGGIVAWGWGERRRSPPAP